MARGLPYRALHMSLVNTKGLNKTTTCTPDGLARCLRKLYRLVFLNNYSGSVASVYRHKEERPPMCVNRQGDCKVS